MAKGMRINKIKTTSEKQFHRINRIKRSKNKAKNRFAQEQRKLASVMGMELDDKINRKLMKKIRKKEAKRARKQKGMDVDSGGIVDVDFSTLGEKVAGNVEQNDGQEGNVETISGTFEKDCSDEIVDNEDVAMDG